MYYIFELSKLSGYVLVENVQTKQTEFYPCAHDNSMLLYGDFVA